MKRKYIIASIVILFAILITLYSYTKPVKFSSLDDAKTKLEAKGFFCICDNAAGLTNGGFLVSTKPMNYIEVVMLTGARARGELPDGVAWLEVLDHGNHNVVPNKNSRMIGRVSAQGKKEFLDYIEEQLR